MNRPERPTGGVKAPGLSPYRIAASPALLPQETQPGDASGRQGSAAPGDRVVAAGLPPYLGTASPGLEPQEIQPDGGPDGQAGGGVSGDGVEVSGALPCPDTAFPGSREPEIEPGDDLSGLGRAEIGRALFKASKIRGMPRAERPRCGARTRSGGRCMAQGLLNIDGQPGRCRMHGGLSTGPRTAAGLERQRQGASESAQRQWAAARAAGRRSWRNPARDANSPDSKNAERAAASEVRHMSPPTHDRSRAHHGEDAHVAGAADTPNFAVSTVPDIPDFDVMSLPCVDDFEMPPERDYGPLPARSRIRPRQEARAPACFGEVDHSAALAEAAEFRRSGGLAAAHAEMMAIGREYLARGGTLVNNAANRRILAEITRERNQTDDAEG